MKDARTRNHVRTAAIGLWVTTGVLLGAAWVTSAIFHPEVLTLMLAATAVVGAIAAAVAHSRIYSLKMQQLVRMTAGLIYDDKQPVGAEPSHGHRRLRSVT